VRRKWSSSSRAYMGFAVVLALSAGLLFNAYLGRVSSPSPTLGPEADVVQANFPIKRGEMIEAAELRVARMPVAYAPPGFFDQISEAAGRVALADLAVGEAVTETRLARVRAGPVASLIPTGLRAFAVPTSLPAGALAPGDLVDILATYGGGGVGQPHTEMVVEGVEVLYVLGSLGSEGGGSSADPNFDTSSAGSGDSATLILLVSTEQEGRLAYARAFADLAVAIAPPPEGG
jgi:Flp pilus assembly protein CpaB